MSIENSWWKKEFAKGSPASQMGGMDGRQGPSFPTHQWFTDHVPEGSTVLDVGCCNAHTLESFKQAGKFVKYTGVDHLIELVMWCRMQYKDAEFHEMDADDLQDFSDNLFDYVLSRHVHEHLNHYSQHFMEMYRVARKEVVIVGFLEMRDDFDRLQYGVKQDGKVLPHWYNQYSWPQMEQFIKYNMPEASYEVIRDYQGTGHPIIVIRKPQ